MDAPTKKPSKLETLNADLVKAEAALVAAKARLEPQIEAERAKVADLRKTYEKLDKATTKLYEAMNATRHAVERDLAPQAAQTRAAIVEKLGDKFPNADVGQLTREAEGRAIAADPRMAAADKAFHDSYKVKDKAYRAWSIANGMGTDLHKMESELRAARIRVDTLKTEIERVPRRNQAAKNRRDELKAEEARENDTVAAREFLKGLS